MAGHDHAHTQPHTHDHDGDTYFLDQICMVGISGAFGAICLALYIMNWTAAADGQSMLKLLLGPQFHLFVLGSGIALVLVSAIRGVTLWRQASRPAHVHTHDHGHDHGHAHDHDHGDCEHEHGVCAHEHAHAIAPHQHDHAQHHHHDHDEADHDHGWAPWRYVLLLVPIVLFLLGLPNKGPQASAATVHLDMTQELALYGGMIASAPRTEGEVLGWLAALYMTEGDVYDVSFKDLESYAGSDELRKEKRGKTIRVRGQFAPSPGNPHVFSLVRFRIACCGADAIPCPVPMVTREQLTNRTDLRESQWISVTGIVDFQQRDGRYFTMLRVMNLSAIKKCDPDSNPYIQ